MLDRRRTVILTAADGHGNPLHARSHDGAAYAVEAAAEVLRRWVGAVQNATEEMIRRSAAGLAQQLVSGWRERVIADLKAHPPTIDENGTVSEQIRRDPTILYGSTLLAAAVTARFAAYIQLGDGDIVTITANRPPQRPVHRRADLALSETESLCLADAAQRMRIRVEFIAKVRAPNMIMLATDGYANSFADDRAFLMVASELKGYLDQNGPDWVGENLSRWLDDTSKKGSGDDITAAVAWRAQQQSRLRPALVAAVLLVALGWPASDWIKKEYFPPPPQISISLIGRSPVNAVAFSRDGALIMAASEQGVTWWNLRDQKVQMTVKEDGGVSALALMPDGKAVVTAVPGGVRILDAKSGQTIAVLNLEGRRIRSLTISPDGKLIVIAGRDGVATWDGKGDAQPLDREWDRVSSLAFATQGNRIGAGGSDGTVKLWDATSRAELASFDAQNGGVWAIEFSPNGDALAIGGQDGNVHLWSVEDKKIIRLFEGSPGRVLSVAFSGDGRYIAAAIGKTVTLFDAQNGQRVASLSGHEGEVHAVEFSPDGESLASGGRDGSIRIWDVQRALAAGLGAPPKR